MRLPLSDRDYVIQGYLDSLTTYASTVCDLLDDDRVASDIGDGFDDGLDHTANPVSPEVKPSVQLDVTTATQKKDIAPLDSTMSDSELKTLGALAESAQDKSLQERVRALKESRQRQKEAQVQVDPVSHISGIPTDKLPVEADEETHGDTKSSVHQPKIEDVSVSSHTDYEIDNQYEDSGDDYGSGPGTDEYHNQYEGVVNQYEDHNDMFGSSPDSCQHFYGYSEGHGHDYDEHYDYGDRSDYDPYSYADSENENWNRAAKHQNELSTGQGSEDKPSKRSSVPIIDLNVAVAEGPSHGTNHYEDMSSKQQTSTATGLPQKQQHSSSPLQATVDPEQIRALPLLSQGNVRSSARILRLC